MEYQVPLLWLPKGSSFVARQRWVDQHGAGPAVRPQVAIVKARDGDIFSANFLLRLLSLHEKLTESNFDGVRYEDVCLKSFNISHYGTITIDLSQGAHDEEGVSSDGQADVQGEALPAHVLLVRENILPRNEEGSNAKVPHPQLARLVEL